MHGISSLFGSLVVIIGGIALLVLIVAPQWGRNIFKNLGVSLGLFVLGCVLLEAACPGHARPGETRQEGTCGTGLRAQPSM